VKSKETYNLMHLLVYLYIFDNARYWNKKKKTSTPIFKVKDPYSLKMEAAGLFETMMSTNQITMASHVGRSEYTSP
jgi:hypothetical protein